MVLTFYPNSEFLKCKQKTKMIREEFLEVVRLIKNDKIIRYIAIFVTLFAILLGIFLSPLAAFTIYSFYILGYVASWFLIKYQNKSSIYCQKLITIYYGRSASHHRFKPSCSICDDLSCRRHQQAKSTTPWKGLYILQDLNVAIEHFYTRIIQNFITSWYETFTEDKDFLNEIEHCLKYATSTFINRFLELDHAEIIANKLLPCVVKHVDDYLYMHSIAKLKNVRFNEVVVEYLGKQLHIATSNRKNEIAYLQHVSGEVLKDLLPELYIKCRNHSVLIREILAGWVLLPLMDVLADPNIINSLVILIANYKNKKFTRALVQTKKVEFLENFAKINANAKKSPFATNLNRIKNNTDVLFAFMQFLKKQEHIHLLQFCLDVDDFNNKLLTPDLSKKQLEELHSKALKLHEEYMVESSPNFINCPSEISGSFKMLIKDIYSVAKLRTSKPLYQAYDHTFNILESTWLPHFFHSNEFYDYICGDKVNSSYKKAPIKTANSCTGSPQRSKKYYDSVNYGTVSKISSSLGKIRGVLKASQPIDGSFFPIENQNLENGNVDEILLSDCKSLFRDLSAWMVTVPSYQTSSSSKVIYFSVSVQRLDVVSNENKMNWIVLRKDQDFYTLKAKLVEFHGESEICDSPLPSRKAGSHIESRMSKYEEFIKKLLRKPTLRGSDLLYTFLTTEEDFTALIGTIAPNVQDIGNIYQSVAYKLRKEKGQHLDSFMNAFLQSTGKAKQEKSEPPEMGEELDALNMNAIRIPPIPKTYKNHVFNDNFGINYRASKETSTSSFNPVGITECLFYLLRNILKVPHGILKVYVAMCNVFQQTIELLAKIWIEKKLRAGLCQPNLAYLVRQLEEVIFNHHKSPTKEELEKRRQKAAEEIEVICPSFVNKILGGKVGTGLGSLLSILQNPQYNKQLAYSMVDIIFLELYPQLGKAEE